MTNEIRYLTSITLVPSLFWSLSLSQMLQEKFTKFCSETNSIGQQRMEQVNKMVNEMIDCGHTDAATIAEWKDGLNESWADLLELMETRRQMLAASHQLHKFFTDCKEVQLSVSLRLFSRFPKIIFNKQRET